MNELLYYLAWAQYHEQEAEMYANVVRTTLDTSTGFGKSMVVSLKRHNDLALEHRLLTNHYRNVAQILEMAEHVRKVLANNRKG